jgi:dTDP-4-dehydrorhamnose reductase
MRILITGASGQLGAYLLENLGGTRHEILALSGSEADPRFGVPFTPVDLTDPRVLEQTLDAAQPDAILHAAAISAAEAVRLDPVRARAINVDATRRISEWADRHSRRLIFTSTDLVFDGSRSWNREIDPAMPTLAYGRTKLEAEASVLAIPRGIVARLCLLFGPSRSGRPYFFDRAIESIRRGESQTFFEDEHRTPLDLATAASILVKLVESDLAGLYHLAGTERMSRFELMSRAIKALGLDPSLVRPGKRADVLLPEPRPADVSLDTSKLAEAFPGLKRPTIEEALALNPALQRFSFG